MNIIEGLIQHQIEFARHIKKELPNILSSGASSGTMDDVSNYSDANYKLCANGLALLYQLKHPKNSLHGESWLKEGALQLLGKYLEHVEILPDGTPKLKEIGSEWYAYTVTQVVKTLEKEVDNETKIKAKAYVEAYAHHAMEEPMFFTAFNHESWRCWTLYNAGQYYQKPEWCERALFFMHQLINCQTPEGFWEETTHHGPSMKYNQLMLSPLAWLSQLSKDAKIKAAATRLSAFMSRWTFPDGTTVGTFDGRQSTSLMLFSPVVPGLEFTETGAELIRRGIDLWESRGCLSEERALGNSTWYAHFSSFSIADALWYYLAYPPTTKSTALEVDKENAELENHTTFFDGAMKRWKSWVIATSAQNTDIPRSGPSVYRLERQSRMELWHQSCGVVFGGGHNITGWDVPYANVVIDTNGEIVNEFGFVEVSKKRSGRASKALYIPRFVKTSIKNNKMILEQIFGHGTFIFECTPVSDNEFQIDVKWNLRGVKKMYLQIPMLLWRKGLLIIDGKEVDGRIKSLTDAVSKVEFLDTIKKSKASVLPPKGFVTKIRTGLSQIRSYGNLFENERFDPPYHINLVSTEVMAPKEQGELQWKITVTPS